MACGFKSRLGYVALILSNAWQTMDLETAQKVSEGKGQEWFKDPYVDDQGNLHWFAYASSDALVGASIAMLEDAINHYFKEYKIKHGYRTFEGRIIMNHVPLFDIMEYEYIAPIEKESNEVPTGG